MPRVVHSWGIDDVDSAIWKWRVYVSKSEGEKGEQAAEVPAADSETEFDLAEGTYYFRVIGVTGQGGEQDWKKALVTTEYVAAVEQSPGDLAGPDAPAAGSDEDRGAGVAEIAPERSMSVLIDPAPRDETPSTIQVIQGDDPDIGKLIAEIEVKPRGPVGPDASRAASALIPVEGMGRTGERKYTMRPMSRGGIPVVKPAVKTESMPPSPEQVHYPVTIASVVAGVFTGWPASDPEDGWEQDAGHGFLLKEMPDIASADADWGADLETGLLASLPAFVPYVNKAKIQTDVYDLGAAALNVPYVLDIFDDLQRYSVNGWFGTADIASLSPYPFNPASDEDVRAEREGPCWLSRESMIDGAARRPIRSWKWQVIASPAAPPGTIPESLWVNHVPGRIYSGRYVIARLVIEEPTGWWRLKIPTIYVRVLFQAALGADSGGTPEARVSRPPASLFVDESTGDVYVKTSGIGNTGYEKMAKASSAGMPAGVMAPFAGVRANIPTGWLECDGSAVSRTTYADLFTAIGTTWGVGDGSTTFNLPNGAARFVKGASGNADLTAGGSASSGSATTGVTVNVPPAGRTAGGVPTGLSGAAVVTDPGHTHPNIDPPNIGAYWIIKT